MPDEQKPWMTVATMRGLEDGSGILAAPAALAAGVTVERVPGWLFEDDLLLESLAPHEKNKLHGATLALISRYAAASLGDPASGTHPKARSKQEVASERVHLANLALVLATPCTGFLDFYAHYEEADPPRLYQRQTAAPLLPHNHREGEGLSAQHLEQAALLHTALLALEKEGTVQVAVSAFSRALQAGAWEIRFVMLWTCLEALLGADREITYRLSLRLSFFLGSTSEEARSLFTTAKRAYGWRSKAVHGLKLSKLSHEKSLEVSLEVEEFCRRTLRKILGDPKLVECFDSNDREAYLDDLPYERWA